MQNQPFIIPSVLILLLSIPLVAGVIPPNRYYGFRTVKAMLDSQVWYRVNRVCGVLLFVSSALYLVLCGLLINAPSVNDHFELWLLHLGVFAIPLFASLAITKNYGERT